MDVVETEDLWFDMTRQVPEKIHSPTFFHTFIKFLISLKLWCIFDNPTMYFSFKSEMMFGHIQVLLVAQSMLINTQAASAVQMTMLTLILTLEYLQPPMMDIMNSFSKLYQ